MDETCDTPCLQVTLGLGLETKPSALSVRCALQMCLVSGCPVYTPVDFLEFFPGNRNHHHLSEDVEYHELQLVCHCDSCHCDVEDEDAADGFLRGSL